MQKEPKITINPRHVSRELPQEIKVQTNINTRHRALLRVGTTCDAAHLGTSAATTLEGSETFIRSNEVSVAVFKSVYFTPR